MAPWEDWRSWHCWAGPDHRLPPTRARNGRGGTGSRTAWTDGKTGSIAGRTIATRVSSAAGGTGAKTSATGVKIDGTGAKTAGIGGGDVQSGSAYAT